MPYKQKGMKFGEGTGDQKVKSTDYLTKTPSIVASERAKQDYEGTDGSNESEEDNDKETVRINTTPNTTPPLFSDDAHGKTKKKVDQNKKNSREANKQERIEDAKGL
tara:strand:- start:131 stop:451 length:321 start_codon:yes stop_codon:yes gene_type:complete